MADSLRIGRYNKFSSMGNGTTFVLETLIFSSICVAMGLKPREFAVYGDDIVVPSESVPLLMKTLRFIGFLPNEEKTHTVGPFRESCGVNAFNGVDITPFYLRDINNRKVVMCHNVNGLVSIGTPFGHLWELCRQLVAELKLPFVPVRDDSMAGVHIDVSTAYSMGLFRNTYRLKDGNHPWTPCFKGYVEKRKSTDPVETMQTLSLFYIERCLGIEQRMKDESEAFSTIFGRENERQSASLSKAFGSGGVRAWQERPIHAAKRLFALTDLPGGLATSLTASWEALRQRSYTRQWVHWHQPVAGSPLHIHSWSDSVGAP